MLLSYEGGGVAQGGIAVGQRLGGSELGEAAGVCGYARLCLGGGASSAAEGRGSSEDTSVLVVRCSGCPALRHRAMRFLGHAEGIVRSHTRALRPGGEGGGCRVSVEPACSLPLCR